jgi:alpha-2-macroglobulin
MTRSSLPRLLAIIVASLLLAVVCWRSATLNPNGVLMRSEPVPVPFPSAAGNETPATPETAPPSPNVSMPLGFQVLTPGRGLPVQIDHLRFARIRALPIQKDEVTRAAQHLGQYRDGDDPIAALPKGWSKRIAQKIFNVGEPRAGVVESYDPFSERKTKLALVILDAPGQPAQVSLVQRGELQVTMKVAKGEGLVWVTSAAGQPVRNAHVELMQGSSRRFSTKTNAEGLASLPPQAKLRLGYKEGMDWEDDYFRPLMAFASKDGQLAFASQRWTTGIEPWEFDIPMHYYYGSGSLVGSVNPERGIYRPGHPVHVVGAIRKRDPNGQLAVPQGKVLVRVLDPDYTSVASEKVTITPYGTFRLDTELPKTARLGRYSIEATVGDTTLYSEFRVAKYRPNRFEVEVAEVEPVILEKLGSVTIETRAKYLYGAPLAGGEVTYDVSLRPAQQRDAQSWTSLPLAYQGSNDGASSIDSGTGKLEDGKHRINLDLSNLIGAYPEAQRLELLVQSSVTDAAGDTLTGHRTIPVEYAGHTVWLRNNNWVVDSRNGWDVEVKSTGKGVTPDAKVTVELYRKSWVSTANQNGAGIRYDSQYETVLVSSQTLTASADSQRVHFRLDKGGTYVAKAFSGDGSTFVETEIWAYGQGSYGRFDNEPRLELHSDRQSYEPGQTARLLVESPYESALALVTLEQDGVVTAHTQRLQGAGSEVKVTLTEKHLPNVYASVSLVPLDAKQYNVAGSPLKTGYVSLQVSPDTRRLEVQVKPKFQEARPGDTVPVEITLTDKQGKPVRGEVTLWATDEGVLQLTGYQTPDVFSPIYRSHYLGVSTSSSLLRFTDLGYRDEGMGGDSGPNGDGQAAFRSRFLETAFFSEGIVTDARGRATVDLELPDNITRWRVMATAADTKNRFGSAEASLTAKKPVQVSPSLPRFLSVGDRLKAGVVVHNDRDHAGKATVTLAVDGATLEGSSTRELEVAAHGQATVEFDVEARHVGRATFRAHVALGGERDGFAIELPVLAVTERHSVKVLDEVMTAKRTMVLALPEGADPDTAELIVESAPGEIATLGAGLDALVEYPHGCTEQTTSRLIPMAQLGGLLSGHPLFEGQKHHDLMQQAVVHLLGHQNHNGGFGLWPESEPESFLTAYALFGLELAREQGLEVPTHATDRAYAYLTSNADGEGYGYIQTEARKPFTAYLFGREKRALPEGLGNLFEQSEQFGPFGKALLVAASPTAPETDPLLATLLGPKSSASELEGWYAGSKDLQQDAGVVLALLAKKQPDRAKPYADAILAARLPGGTFGSTQDNLWALTALNQYFRMVLTDTRYGLSATLSGSAQGENEAAGSRSKRLDSTKEQLYRQARFEVPSRSNQLELVPDPGNRPGRVVARLAFNETPERHQPRNSGFAVKRRIVDLASGAEVEHLRVGQLVNVEIQVESSVEMNQVALIDRLPAGLEAVDLELDTSPKTQDNGEPHDYTWVYREAHDERVSFFSDAMSSGHHVVRYVARATRRGEFVHPPPRAEAMYQADFYGYGALDTLTVE